MPGLGLGLAGVLCGGFGLHGFKVYGVSDMKGTNITRKQLDPFKEGAP